MGECKSLSQHAHVGNTGGRIQDHHFRTFQRRLIWRFANRNRSPGEIAAARFKFALKRKEFFFRSVDSRVQLKWRLNSQSSRWKGTIATRCTQANNRFRLGVRIGRRALRRLSPSPILFNNHVVTERVNATQNSIAYQSFTSAAATTFLERMWCLKLHSPTIERGGF